MIQIDITINDLQKKLNKKLGVDKIPEGISVKETKFDPKKFSKLAEEVNKIFEKDEQSHTISSFRY